MVAIAASGLSLNKNSRGMTESAGYTVRSSKNRKKIRNNICTTRRIFLSILDFRFAINLIMSNVVHRLGWDSNIPVISETDNFRSEQSGFYQLNPTYKEISWWSADR
jgi:hypothetical protein